MLARLLHRSFRRLTAAPERSLLHLEREYLEGLSSSPIFTGGRASPSAPFERDLRFEELLTKAISAVPQSVPLSTNPDWREALIVFHSYRNHGVTSTWAFNQMLAAIAPRNDADQFNTIIDLMRADSILPNASTFNTMLVAAHRPCPDLILREMLASSVSPNRRTLLLYLRRATNIDRAIELCKSFQQRKFIFEPNDAAFNLLLKLSPADRMASTKSFIATLLKQ